MGAPVIINGQEGLVYCTDRKGSGKDLSPYIQSVTMGFATSVRPAGGFGYAYRVFKPVPGEWTCSIEADLATDVVACFGNEGRNWKLASSGAHYPDLALVIHRGPGALTKKGADDTDSFSGIVIVESFSVGVNQDGTASVSVALRLSHQNIPGTSHWVPATDDSKALSGTSGLALEYNSGKAAATYTGGTFPYAT